MLNFAIALIPEDEGDYGIVVPDIPGCFSVGDNIAEAIANAHEAIECHLEGIMMDDEPIPVPQAIELHQENPEYEGVIWAIASIDLSKLAGKAKRINITMPESILSKVDSFAAQKGETRSGLLQTAALNYIAENS